MVSKAKTVFGNTLDNLVAEISEMGEEQHSSLTSSIPVSKIIPGKWQVRKVFDKDALDELTSSIKTHGFLQPILVRCKPESDDYEILAGERRWRAAIQLGLDCMPAIVKDLDDGQCTAICLIENIQRENLNIIEEAEAYRTLIDELGLTQEEVSRRVGKSRSHITNIMRLISLPQDVQAKLKNNEISVGHAKLLLSPSLKSKTEELVEETIKNKLSVRDLEKIVANTSTKKFEGKSEPAILLEKKIADILGKKVSVSIKKNADCDEFIFTSDISLKVFLESL